MPDRQAAGGVVVDREHPARARVQAERQGERPVMVLDLGNPGDAALATQHGRREVVDSGKDNGDPGQDLVAVLQKDVEGGVVQNEREVDWVVAVFA